jgi:hypothetical protein
LKKYGFDIQTMYDGEGNLISEKEAIEIMRKRHGYAKLAAKVLFDKLNEKCS